LDAGSGLPLPGRAKDFCKSIFRLPQGSINEIDASNYTPPLIVRWDTSLFHAPFLPSTPTSYIRYAGLLNYYFWMSGEANFGTDGFDMMLVDSVVVGPMLVEWFFTSSYMLFAYESWLSTGISEVAFRTFTLHPNPTTGLLQVQLHGLRPRELWVSDALGRVVLRQAMPGTAQGALPLDLSALGPGAYLVTVLDAEGMRHTQRVVRE
jgi:hypothetical protein